MNILVGLANSPQVLFLFLASLNRKKEGIDYFLTTLRHSETISLADCHGLSHKVIGAYRGGDNFRKGDCNSILNYLANHKHPNYFVASNSRTAPKINEKIGLPMKNLIQKMS